METLALNTSFSTGRLVIREKLTTAGEPDSKVPSLLFLPPNPERRGEGGLRVKKRFKPSYDEANDLVDASSPPLITIISVVLNGEKHLEKTIRSVVNQTCKNIEYVIIDGGSRDGTLDIIHRFEDKINYWVSEPDKGIYDAMNKGWQLSDKGSYILFLGAGDEIINIPKIPIEVEAKEVIFGNVIITAGQMYNARRGFKLFGFKMGNSLHHQGLLVNKSFWEAPPFDLRYKIYADYDFNIRLLRKGASFIFRGDLVSQVSPGGVSAKVDVVEMLSIIRKYYGNFWAIIAMVYYLFQGIKYGFDGFSFNSK